MCGIYVKKEKNRKKRKKGDWRVKEERKEKGKKKGRKKNRASS